MATEFVKITKNDKGIATLTLSDTSNRNAMGEEMASQFAQQVQLLRQDAAVRVVVLRGDGAAFSGGGHMEMLREKPKLSAEENRRRMEWFYDSFLSIRALEVPVIAALNGHAIGAGLCVALACDIRIARAGAKFGLNFVALGLHPGMGATYFLPRIVGPGRAAELLYTGKIISADYAAQIGLVNHVITEAEFETFVGETADAIATAGPVSIRELKLSLRNGPTATLEDALRREAECQARSYGGKEYAEGIAAAGEKRRPQF